MSEFSVIIPTLQRAKQLHELVERCAAHPLVLEVLVINNAPEPLAWASPKVRVLQQERNIYVNPAWNLGAREARGKYLAIVNDDLQVEDDLLTHGAAVLRRGLFGIVGPDRSVFNAAPSSRPVSHRLARMNSLYNGFGTFMMLRRADYVPIPEELRIFHGDHWLYLNQRKPSAVVINTRVITDMSVTSGSAEFSPVGAADAAAAVRLVEPLHGSRWWHRPVDAIHRARDAMYRTRRSVAR